MMATMCSQGKLLASLLAILVLGMSACSRREAPPDFSVRLLTSLAVSGRWERAAERGLGRIAAELDADVARIRVGDAADRRNRINDQGRAGVSLVFCVGNGFEKMLYSEVGAFPSTAFVLLQGRANAQNLGGIVFLPEEAGYLAGVVAGTGVPGEKVGILRGGGRRWLNQLENGFKAGFVSLRPGDEVVTAEGPEGVWQLARSGVGVALYSSDRADPAVLAAVHDAGLKLIVTGPELMESEPDLVVAAVEVDVAEAMLRVAREVKDGTFEGRIFAFDLGSGVLDLTLNETMEAENLRAVREAVEKARSEITAGFVEIAELGL